MINEESLSTSRGNFGRSNLIRGGARVILDTRNVHPGKRLLISFKPIP
jgi:hypothetical protein